MRFTPATFGQAIHLREAKRVMLGVAVDCEKLVVWGEEQEESAP
jgi:hypothetical protein